MSFAASIDAGLLADRLATLGVGEPASYADLTAVIGTDVRRGRGLSALRTARRQLQRERQMVFNVERGVGLRRLSDDQVVEAGASYLAKVRRAARRGAKLVTSVSSYEALPAHLKVRHNAQVSIFGAIEAVAAGKAVARLGERTGAKPLPISATIDAFRAMVGG